jgi:HlyD family type I secretion membrane fusion protein
MNAAPTLAGARPHRIALAALLADAAPLPGHAERLRALRRALAWPLAAAALLLGAWTAWAPLSGAVVADGRVQAELGRKTVQHLEGGIVSEVKVREGQRVSAGDALLVVADVRSDAALDLLRKQLAAERLRVARLRAELALAARVDWPDAGAAGTEALARERLLFETRRRALEEQLAALRSQAQGARARAAALSAQIAAADAAVGLTTQELALHEPLVAAGYEMRTRLVTLQRGLAEQRARVAAARGQRAEAGMQAGALAHATSQLRGQHAQRAADELERSSARARELEERLRPADDQARRQVVRAPVDGVVTALKVSAAGTAVGPREPLLEIVPEKEALVVELRIDPHDIDHVRVGGAAEVRLAAFDVRATPLLPATVTVVSPDALADPATGRAAYVAQVEVSARALRRHPQLRLQAGMPAEVFVTTPARTLLDELLRPLRLHAWRALREP